MIGGASLLALAACADDEDGAASSSASEPGPSASPSASATTADGSWEYTDDLGGQISLDKRPTTILAYSSTGAVLWNLGIRVDGTMGPLRNEDGRAVKSAGRMDLGSLTDVGQEEVELEKIATLRPDIIVLQVNSGKPDAYPLTDEQLDEARKIAPSSGPGPTAPGPTRSSPAMSASPRRSVRTSPPPTWSGRRIV